MTSTQLLLNLKEEKQRRTQWIKQARAEQLIPSGNWNIWLILAGRGFGKTRTGAETIKQFVQQGYKRVCLLGHSELDVMNVMLKGKSGLLSIYEQSPPTLLSASRKIIWENGATALIASGCAYEQLRGPEFDCAWIDELAKFPDPKAAFDQLQLALRIDSSNGLSPKMIITTTPKSSTFLKELIARDDVYVTYGSTFDNQANLSQTYLQAVTQTFQGTRFGAQELYGQIVDYDNEAFCKREQLKYDEISSATQITIAIDPAASNTRDETGLIVCGKIKNGYIILEDASARMTPTQWATKAVHLYHKYKASMIVAEVNQGGDMVETLIKQINPLVNYKKVHAVKSKIMRAQPIAALYEQGKVWHRGIFPALEQQMFEEIKGHNSPDRLDALVWGLTHLSEIKEKGNSFFMKIK